MNYHFILTNGRSGSNYLVNTFNLHPEITNYGEILGEWTLPYKLYQRIGNNLSISEYIDFIYKNRSFFTVAQFYSALSKFKKKEKINFKRRNQIKNFGGQRFLY